jgi:protein phosphatase
MPWSAKARELLRTQYAPVGTAGRAMLAHAGNLLRPALARSGGDETLTALAHRTTARAESIERYVRAYGTYCWSVVSPADLRLAPFHLLASEGAVHVDKPHAWHMATADRLVKSADAILFATPWRSVPLADQAACDDAMAWWSQRTANGSEGMVIKPAQFVHRGKKGMTQPAVKCRGPEYLRIIYGPEYDLPQNLDRLRKRAVAAKRSLAVREFALGIEALERFVRKEPLRRVHECVFGVLALESEPLDPRL